MVIIQDLYSTVESEDTKVRLAYCDSVISFI